MEALLFCLVVIATFLFIMKKFKEQKMPPGPLGLPILGHLHLLKNPLHRTLQFLAAQYGPIFSIRLGSRPAIIVSSPSLVHECFTTNDITFADRPTAIAGKHTGYNHTVMSWAPYGDHWRNLRRVMTIHMFSSHSLTNSAAVRNSEVRRIVRDLYRRSNRRSSQSVDMAQMFLNLTSNVITRMLNGKECSEVKKVFTPITLMNVSDYVPILRWLGRGQWEKRMKMVHKERDTYLQGLIDDFRHERSQPCTEVASDGSRSMMLMENLLDLQDAEPDVYTDDIIKGILLLLFTAGMDTSARTMEWAMSLLLNHPDALEKARKEIDDVVGQGRLVEDSDIGNLSYLRFIVNEALRLFPVTPLLVPHFSSEDCKIGGYHVPKGTTLLVNAWAVHRDENIWEEPDKFKPERFEGVEGDHGCKFIPFGVGRRSCPGANMAVRLIGVTLGAFIQCFDWKRTQTEMEDMSEGSGLTLPKKKPLVALCSPRCFDNASTLLSQL